MTNNITVEKKQSLVKVYLGAEVEGGKNYLDVAPDASIVFSDRYMLDFSYYILNQHFSVGGKVKLSFKK